MLDDLWLTVDLPVLTAVAEAEATMSTLHTHFKDWELCEATGLTQEELRKSVLRLVDGQYIDATPLRSGGGIVSCHIRGVLERGRRATGQWPPDDAYLSLLSLLTEHMEEAPDEVTRSKWRSAIEGVAGLGREVGVQLTAEWIKRMTMG